MASARKLTVALAGNPNSGKTTLSNNLTGARRPIGNFPIFLLRRFIMLTLTAIVFFPMNASLAAQIAGGDEDNSSMPIAVSEIRSSTPNQAIREMRTEFSREWLESKGIGFNTGYRAETFSSVRGGVDNKFGANYLGSADVALDFTLSKMGLGRGHIVLSAQSLHGRGISERKVGTVQAVSNMEEGSFSKLIEAHYTDGYLGKKVAFKVGRQYADGDFDVLANAGDFLNSSYGLTPTVPMPTYPVPQLGGSAWVSPTGWLSVGAGMFRGNDLDPVSGSGATTGKGVFTILEVKVSPYSKGSAIHGIYHVGVWQQGNGTYRTNATEGDKSLRNYGLYATADHWFRKQDSAGNNIGPGVFFQLGWSPEDRNSIHRYIGGGFAWPGVIQKRNRDSIGIGVTSAWIRGAKQNDTVTELFYKAKVTSKVFIQPDLQYAYKPGGNGADTLLAGMRLGLEF